MSKEHQLSEKIVLFYTLFILVTGLFFQSFETLFLGLQDILTSTGVLISDYMVIGGMGPALVNGGLVGLIGMIIIKINRVPMTGPTIATVFLLIGFGFFGKNIWTILPVIFGVYIYSTFQEQKFRQYIYPALFGTALAPIVSQVAFGSSLGILGGIVIGTIAGVLIPPVATHLLQIHEGYTLYNVGFAAGFVGLLLVNLFRGYGFEPESLTIWGTEFDTSLRWIIIGMTVSMIVIGYFINDKSFKGYKEVFKHPGVLVTDYIDIVGVGNTLINMGLVGLIGVLYIELVNGSYNGATLGGIFTIIGFGAFGKNPKNILPIMIGVYLGTIFSSYNPSDPGPLLAALFGTTLAPLAGKFGSLTGILAGFFHLSVVIYTGALHGGLNLYNNGFASGIVATIFVAVINGFDDNN